MRVTIIFALIISVVSCVVVVQYLGESTVSQPLLNATDNSATILNTDEQKSIIAGLHRLFDPKSAEFRGIVRSKLLSDVICGEINAKNRFGGYVGFMPFSASLKSPDPALVSVSHDKDFNREAIKEQQRRMGCSV